MTHKISLALALLILIGLGVGWYFHGWEMFIFFGKQLIRAVDYLAIWR